jgi:hypothetical protein
MILFVDGSANCVATSLFLASLSTLMLHECCFPREFAKFKSYFDCNGVSHPPNRFRFDIRKASVQFGVNYIKIPAS